ncbi:MAG TPA: SPOR domain-containing protein [Gammaproteobacteria bacterium]
MSSTSRDFKGRKMSEKKPVPGYVWMLAGLVIGLFAAFLVYLSKQPAENINFTESVKQELQKAREQDTVEISETKSTDNSDAEKPANNKPRFEFYTILSELEVFVPEPEIESKQTPKSTAKTDTKILTGSSGEAKKYILQAGSFKSLADAERHKATLALLGVQSSIQSVAINNDHWHRVRIGPFSRADQLYDTLSTLKQNNIQAMTMELK